MLPHFIIAGAHKSASTSLINYLNYSTQVSCITTLDDGNEVNFFSRDSRYKKGVQWYEDLFSKFPQGQIVGEKSVAYMSNKDAPQRIAQTVPNVKLIFIMRNPVNRAFSHYNYNVQKGTEMFSFKKALAKEEQRLARGGFFYNNYSYKSRSCFVEHIQEYLKYFPLTQMYFVLMEDLQKDPAAEMAKLCTFLEISADFIPQIDFSRTYNKTQAPRLKPVQFGLQMSRKVFRIKFMMRFIDWLISKNLKSVGKQVMPPELRRRLKEYFKEPNRQLQQLTGKDLSAWEDGR